MANVGKYLATGAGVLLLGADPEIVLGTGDGDIIGLEGTNIEQQSSIWAVLDEYPTDGSIIAHVWNETSIYADLAYSNILLANVFQGTSSFTDASTGEWFEDELVTSDDFLISETIFGVDYLTSTAIALYQSLNSDNVIQDTSSSSILVIGESFEVGAFTVQQLQTIASDITVADVEFGESTDGVQNTTTAIDMADSIIIRSNSFVIQRTKLLLAEVTSIEPLPLAHPNQEIAVLGDFYQIVAMPITYVIQYTRTVDIVLEGYPPFLLGAITNCDQGTSTSLPTLFAPDALRIDDLIEPIQGTTAGPGVGGTAILEEITTELLEIVLPLQTTFTLVQDLLIESYLETLPNQLTTLPISNLFVQSRLESINGIQTTTMQQALITEPTVYYNAYQLQETSTPEVQVGENLDIISNLNENLSETYADTLYYGTVIGFTNPINETSAEGLLEEMDSMHVHARNRSTTYSFTIYPGQAIPASHSSQESGNVFGDLELRVPLDAHVEQLSESHVLLLSVENLPLVNAKLSTSAPCRLRTSLIGYIDSPSIIVYEEYNNN